MNVFWLPNFHLLTKMIIVYKSLTLKKNILEVALLTYSRFSKAKTVKKKRKEERKTDFGEEK